MLLEKAAKGAAALNRNKPLNDNQISAARFVDFKGF